MDKMWPWITLIVLGFFAMVAVLSVTGQATAEQKHKHEIECIDHGGKMEYLFGQGMTCNKH